MKIEGKIIDDGFWTGWEETLTFTDEEIKGLEKLMEPENFSKMMRECSLDLSTNNRTEKTE